MYVDICVYSDLHRRSGARGKFQEYIIQELLDCDRKSTQIGLG